MSKSRFRNDLAHPFTGKHAHLTDPVDRRLSVLIARSMRVPGRHGLAVFWREFMQRGYEAVKQLPKADRR